MKNGVAYFLLCVLISACSTKAFVTQPASLKGKRVAVAEFTMSTRLLKNLKRVDTLCDCLAIAATEQLFPPLMNAGLVVINLPVTGKPRLGNWSQLADSLHVDYWIVGKALINYTGSTAFAEELTIKLVDVKTMQLVASGTFVGPSVTPSGAAERIGKQMAKQIK